MDSRLVIMSASECDKIAWRLEIKVRLPGLQDAEPVSERC